MSDGPLQFTKREMQRAAGSPLLWAALCGASLVLGMVGPFGTFEALALPARLAYWTAVVVATYFLSFGTVCLLEKLLFARRPGLGGYALLGTLSGPPVTAFVWVLNNSVFDDAGIAFLPLLFYVTAIATVASGLIALFSERLAERGVSSKEDAPPALLSRLPPHLRGRLLHLSMQDHYVEVNTDKGSHLVLMRMSDAVSETGPVEGLRIHRSHWVALDAIARTLRRDDRVFLKLTNGAELPVSRGRQAALRDAGFR